MYDRNSARIDYYGNHKSDEDEYAKEESKKKSFLSFLFRKIGNGQS